MSREAVLGAVRRALDGRARVDAAAGWSFPSPVIDDLVARFAAEATLVGSEVVEARGGEWWAALRPFAGDQGAVFAGPDVEVAATGLPVVDAAAAAAKPAEVLGLVRGSWGIAESGSVVVEADGAHGPSLLSEVSAVLLPRDRIVAGLESLPVPDSDVRARILVTGPSRTADIEKRLVMGAHGPKRVVLVLV